MRLSPLSLLAALFSTWQAFHDDKGERLMLQGFGLYKTAVHVNSLWHALLSIHNEHE